MKRVRYSVAASLDGFIAGPNGEYDWILMDPDIDFAAMADEFDTILMGRKSFDVTRADASGEMFDMATYVFSRTLNQADFPGVTVVSEDAEALVRELKEQPGKDIWLFGGGILFRCLLDAGLVDTVEVAIIPVLLGRGIPLLPHREANTSLKLSKHQVLPTTGTTILSYDVA